MKKSILLICMVGVWAAAHARSEHKHAPLTWEQLPQVCQQYFTRAQGCYDKAGKQAALFHQGNTDFLRQALPAATPEQRNRMCVMANESFAEKAKQLKCE